MSLTPLFPGTPCEAQKARLAVYETHDLTKSEWLIFEVLADLDRLLMDRRAVFDPEQLAKLSFSTVDEYKEDLAERIMGDIRTLELYLKSLGK